MVCDYYSDDLERGDSLFLDRPFVWAAAEMLPFKDKAFDYSIASHILEHVDDPASVLNELSRVSKAGYIETPSAFHEFAVPYPTHVSRCSIVDGKFVVVMKDSWNQQLDARYFDLQNELRTAWRRLADLDALGVQTRYRWRDHIEFEVHGMVMFDKSVEAMESVRIELRRSLIRRLIIKLVYALMKPRPSLDLSLVLACPLCHGDLELNGKYETAICSACNITYPNHKGYLDFRPMQKGRGERVSSIVPN